MISITIQFAFQVTALSNYKVQASKPICKKKKAIDSIMLLLLKKRSENIPTQNTPPFHAQH